MLSDFVAWLRTQSGEYDYFSNTDCPFARFLKDTGRATNPAVGGFVWCSSENSHGEIPEPIRTALFMKPTTYEALLERVS